MGFTSPWVLAGLVTAAIPLLLHLFARRDPPTVVFPAVRYLDQTARRHQRRLSLQHWLLLLVRTLLLVALVLAAAGPTSPGLGRGFLGAHSPSTLVLIVDNSLSAGAVHDGVPVWDEIRRSAKAVLARATAADHLVLLAADQFLRRGEAEGLGHILDSLVPTSRRVDLGDALRAGQAILRGARLPGEIILLSDLQRSAATAAAIDAPLLVGRPTWDPPLNNGIAGLTVSAQPWGGDGGLVGVRFTSDTARRLPFTVQLDDGVPQQRLSTGEVGHAVRLTGVAGWRVLRAELSPDELRADDMLEEAIRILPPPEVSWQSSDTYLATAADVLVESGRITLGRGPSRISLGAFGGAASVIFPPSDPAQLGALNRTLAGRGSRWRYGPVEGAGILDSSVMTTQGVRIHRYRRLLSQDSDTTGVLLTVGGSPWLVRDEQLLLFGSRLDPTWTDLPFTAGFVPFLDRLLTRTARGTLASLHGYPGDRISVPDRATAVVVRSDVRAVEGGGWFVPTGVGPHFLLEGADTVGVINVGFDPRESTLERITDIDAKQLWPGVRFSDLTAVAGRAFQAGIGVDLRGPLLWLVALLALVEVGLASGTRRRS